MSPWRKTGSSSCPASSGPVLSRASALRVHGQEHARPQTTQRGRGGRPELGVVFYLDISPSTYGFHVSKRDLQADVARAPQALSSWSRRPASQPLARAPSVSRRRGGTRLPPPPRLEQLRGPRSPSLAGAPRGIEAATVGSGGQYHARWPPSFCTRPPVAPQDPKLGRNPRNGRALS